MSEEPHGTVPSVPEDEGRSEENDAGTEGTVPADVVAADAVEQDLDALLADVKRERDEYLDLAQRARADFENYRKRAARDVADAERRGKAAVGRDLVGVADNLERALIAVGLNPEQPDTDEVEASTQEVSPERALIEGVALVYRELRAALQRAGIEAYDPAGERFDPQWHEALSTKPDSGAESGTIVETLQKGYRVDGQVLRPARVVVAG